MLSCMLKELQCILLTKGLFSFFRVGSGGAFIPCKNYRSDTKMIKVENNPLFLEGVNCTLNIKTSQVLRRDKYVH